MKKQHFFAPLIALLLAFTIASPVLALDEPQHDAYAAVVVEQDTGAILYERNADERVYPASTTKIMTVLLAVEAMENGDFSIGDTLTVSESALADMVADGSSINLSVGEEMDFESLLYAAMVASANDACNVLAEYIGGSIPGFVKLMNDRAAELGAVNTNFVNPHGLHDDNHYTTARDLYLITQQALTHTTFVELCNTIEKAIPATNMSEARTLESTNFMINPSSSSYYEYAAGVKTGRTEKAGQCLVSTAAQGDVALIAVVMGVGRDLPIGTDTTTSINHFTETRALYDWAFDNFSYRDILTTADSIARVPVAMGEDADNVTLKPSAAISALVPADYTSADVAWDYVVYSHRDNEELTAPIASGDILGEISVTYSGNTYGPIPLVAATDIQLSRVEYMKGEVSSTLGNIWVKIAIGVLILLIVLYVVYVVNHSIQKRKRRKQRMHRK